MLSQLLSRLREGSTISPPLSGYSKVRRTTNCHYKKHYTQREVLTFITGIKAKVENIHQYEEYLNELKPVRDELGINLKEDLYPQGTDSPFYNP